MSTYTVTAAGHSRDVATIAHAITMAREHAVAAAGPTRVTITVTTPRGTDYPIAFTADPDQHSHAGVAAFIDEILWDLRAYLHHEQDTAPR